MKVAYVRVSTEQIYQDSSVTRQLETFNRMGCDRILTERESATSADRPKYQELIKAIKTGEVNEVVASRSDRLNRNQQEMRYFYNLCIELGVAWTFTDEPELSSSSPWGAELRSQKAYEAQIESERIGRRVERAYIHAEDTGRAIARRKTLGYRINKGKFELDRLLSDQSNLIGNLNGNLLAEADVARLLVDCFLEHQSLRQALKYWKTELSKIKNGNQAKIEKLKRLHNSGLRRWLENPVLRGHTAYGKNKRKLYGDKLEQKTYQQTKKEEWRIKWNTHPDQALISETEYLKIQSIIENNRGYGYVIAARRSPTDLPPSLSSILRCKLCGLRYICNNQRSNGKTYRYYYCRGKGKESHDCPSKNIEEQKLVKQIILKITAKAHDILFMAHSSKLGKITVPNGHMELLKKEADDALNKYQVTGIREFLNLHNQLKNKIEQIESSRLVETQQAEQNVKQLRALSSPAYWQSQDHKTLHQDLKALIRDCWIENGVVIDVSLVLQPR